MTNSIKCPQCKSDKVIPIVYGMPRAEMLEEEKRGELEIGGCCIIEGISPNRRCTTCGYTWYEPDDILA